MRYRVEIIRDDGSTLSLGNYSTHVQDVIKITNNRQNIIGIMSLELNNSDGYDIDFSKFNNIEMFVYNDDVTTPVKRFSGEVVEVDPNEDNTKVKLLCKDWNNTLKVRYISGHWTNIDLGLLIKNVLDEKCSEFDTSGINTSTGVILDEVKADAIWIKDFFDDLFRENNYQINITVEKVADLFENNKGASAITLSDGVGGNVLKGTVNLKRSNISTKNSVTVIGGQETIVDYDLDQFTWNTGNTKSIVLPNAVSNLQWVKFAGATKTEGTDFEISASGQVLTLITIADTNTVDMRYDYKSSVWWKETDLSASSVREHVLKDETLVTQTRAENIAKTLLAKFNSQQTKGDIGSISITDDFGWYETLILDLASFTGAHIIVGFIETITNIYTVKFSLSEVLDENTKKIFEILKDLDKLKSADLTTSTIKDGYNAQDLYSLLDLVEGWERGVGDRWIFNHPTNSKMNDGKVMRTGNDYSTTETQFL